MEAKLIYMGLDWELEFGSLSCIPIECFCTVEPPGQIMTSGFRKQVILVRVKILFIHKNLFSIKKKNDIFKVHKNLNETEKQMCSRGYILSDMDATLLSR